MSAYNNGEIASTQLPGMDALKYTGELSFVESINISKKDIERYLKLLDEARGASGSELDPLSNEINGKIVSALSTINARWMYRRGDLVRQSIRDNALVIDSNGVVINRTGLYSDSTESFYHLDLDDTALSGYTDVRDLPSPYNFDLETTNYFWNQENAKISENVGALLRYIRKMLQKTPSRIWIPSRIMEIIKYDPRLWDAYKLHAVGTELTSPLAMLGKIYPGIEFQESNAGYFLDKEITADHTLGTTTITVNNTDGIEDGAAIIIYSKDHFYKYYGVVSSATGTTITLPTGGITGTGTIPAGSRIKLKVSIIPDDSIVVELAEKLTQYTATPSVFAGTIDRPGFGQFAHAKPSPEPWNPYMKVWAGFEGRIDVYEPNFVTLKVLD
jgi:hypothetical protein